MYDVIVVGGGPAGLSAALVLGRCRRRVLVCDAGQPRNARAPAVHGYLTRDGVAPAAFLRAARADLEPYDGVEVRDVLVHGARRRAGGFEVSFPGGRAAARKLVLATGVADEPPPVPGLAELFGRGVFHCPYCDGWEVRGQPLIAYGRGHAGVGMALGLTCWSGDVVLCTDGPAGLSRRDRGKLARRGVGLREERVARLQGEAALEGVVLAGGDVLECRALFFEPSWRQKSDLPGLLGCAFTSSGVVRTNGGEEALGVPGLYVVGDASAEGGMVVIAAAEGAKAAVAINKALIKETLAAEAPLRQPHGAA